MSLFDSKTESNVELTEPENQKYTESSNTVTLVIDDLLESEVGACGLWQWSLVCLAIFSTAATSNFPNFFDTEPRQRCYMGEEWEAEFAKNGLRFEQIMELTGGNVAQMYGKAENYLGCERYAADWEKGPLVPLNQTDFTRLPVEQLTNMTVPCPHGYVFAFSEHQYQGGIVTEMNLVCDRHWMLPVGTSFFMVGMISGYVFSGIWAGRFGRKNALICFSVLELIATWLCSIVQNYWLFSFLRFVVAVGSYAKLSAFNLIILEITVAKYRSLFNALTMLGFNCVGRLILVAVAYGYSNWRALNFGASLHCALTFTYFCLVPESPRWLLTQERVLDAIRVLKRGRRFNYLHKPGHAPSELLERLCQQEQYESTTAKASEQNSKFTEKRVLTPSAKSVREQFILLLSDWKLIRITLLSVLIFNTYSFNFMGLVLYTRMIRQSVFMVSLGNSLITIPGVVVAILCYRLFRHRRLPLVAVLFFCGSALMIGGLYTYITQPKQDWVMTVALEVGMMLYSTVQCLFFIYIPELYPPAVRSQGFGLASGLGRAGSIGATYVNDLDHAVGHAVPMVLYASLTLLEGLAVLCLPDTTGEERGERNWSTYPSDQNTESIDS
ncbi:hypothetical protein D915_008755 [Fasciola hepatica]|uniref:Major facilitator superfamily (MFS) profile domain-containing protein n=1 Tax=Fasciola hepatica TaxID=6192 RepID=A0A4E0RH72_FASHE|nr:hypothetical protein D915_008755 [Fasciola hepatica]